MKDFILGLVFTILGATVIFVAQQYPTMASLQYGPSLFPSLIGGGFFLGGLILAVSHAKPALGSLRHSSSAAATVDYRGLAISLLPCLLIVLYILFSETLGAALSMALIMVVLMRLRGVTWPLALGISAIAAVLISWVFSRYLLIPLPEGLLGSWG